MSKLFATVLTLLIAAASIAAPQQDAAKPAAAPAVAPASPVPDGGMPAYIREETPERRMARLGTPEDPGIDPDPKKKFGRFGHVYHISKYERRLAVYDADLGFVRPLGMVNFAYEIYQQNDKYVWVWMPEPLPAEKVAEDALVAQQQYNEDTLNYFRRIRPQFAELNPPAAAKTVRFESSSDGLPTAGSWRNSLAVADMNKDGFADLIAPPERGGRSTNRPSIFLGDGKGKWRFWETVKWPRGLDYGSVAAADFNKDGHQDLAFGVHLRGVAVFFGDSAGNFTTSRENGLPNNFPTRRVVVADLNRDGWQDLVALSEGPTSLGAAGGKLKGYLNRQKGSKWEEVDLADPKLSIGGDWLSVADLNGDNLPDFVTASVYFGGASIVHLSAGGKKWKDVVSDGDLLPLLAYFGANATGRFVSKAKPDAVIAFTRHWPGDVDARLVPTPPLTVTSNIDRLTITKEGLKRIPIARWAGAKGVWGMAAADFDGDGNEDIIYARNDPREAKVLLGDGKGGFSDAPVDGLPLEMNASYDLKVADVNGDKRPDVIVMYETGGTTALSDRDGSIQVFLNRGPAAATAGAQ